MQFFYNREVVVGKSDDGKTDIKETRRDSFNPELVIRSYEHQKGKLLILLADGHEETQEIPVTNKSGKITGYQKQRNWMQSEIYLNEEDTKRYREYFDIEPHVILQNEQTINTLEAVKNLSESETVEA